MQQRQRKVLFFCLGAALLLTAVVWAISRDRDREPMYEGHTLREWADLSLRHGDRKAYGAIVHMGTNTFPLVLKWLRYEPPPWKRKVLRRLSVLLPDWLMPVPLAFWLDDMSAKDRVDRAYQVLDLLKANVASIAPELLRLSYDKSDVVANRAFTALGDAGTMGVPYLIRAILDPHHPRRAEAARQIGVALARNSAATNAIPALLECTADKDVGFQSEASVALASWVIAQPEGAEIDEFKRSVGSTNGVFLRTIRHFERLLIDHRTNDSPVP